MSRSYDFDRFPDPQRRAEIERLHRQASVLLDRELGLLRGLGLAPEHRFLEVGCGPGFLTGAVANLLPRGRAVGLDLSAELLAVARGVVAPARPNLAFHEGSAYELPFPDQSFDFVYSRLVFQHLDRPEVALAEARRVVAPGGRVCVLDIDDGWLSLHPPSPAFEDLNARAIEAKRALGGDRLVGRKLAWLMGESGFSHVEQRVELVSSLELGPEVFLQLTTCFKARLVEPEDAAALIGQICSDLAASERRVGLAAVFVTVGMV